MNTKTMRGVLVATAVLALAIGACKKKPKDDQAKSGDTMAAMDSMMAAAMDAMEPAMRAEPRKTAMRPAGMDAARPAPAGEAVTIKFYRPSKVGDKYKQVAKGKVDQKTLLNGKPLPQQTRTHEFVYEGEHEVKAVHAGGKPTKQEIKVVKLQLVTGGKSTDLLPAGTVVVATAEGNKGVFKVKGKAVDPKAAAFLKELVSLHDDDPYTTDDIFGPGGPKKVGESWKPNLTKMLASLKKAMKDFALTPKVADMSGKVTFVAEKKIHGMDAMQVQATAKLNNFAPKMGPVKMTKGMMEMSIGGWMPKDPKIAHAGTMNMSTKMHWEGEFKKGGQDFKMVMDVNRFLNRTTTPMK